jgi:predicted acyltransferase
MGILQRIAICYLISALLFLHTKWKHQVAIVIGILFLYWGLITLVNVPGCEVTTIDDKACNLAAYVDRVVLGVNHLWEQSKVYDPEGLLSTLPAIATTLIGVLTGQWLRSARNGQNKFVGMLGVGVILSLAGLIWSIWFPLNKSLWTSSFVIFAGGLAIGLLSFFYWIIDLKGYKKWSWPFLVFGSNAIAVYVGSTIFDRILSIVEFSTPNGQTVLLQERIFTALFLPVGDSFAASFLYAISFVLLFLLLMWPLYSKKILIRI